jgi:hypothetical protein
VYSRDASGMSTISAAPKTPMPPSSHPTTFSGCRVRLTTFDSSNEPAHMPPMNEASNTARDTADDPITSSSI